jgi:predicted AlkP superfamily phosphohydrolase/phosphomutase
MVTSFLTPSIESPYTYPAELKREIADLVGEYMLDVRNFRTENKGDLLKQIYEMTEKRMTLAKHLMRTRPWDFFMVVEMGTDRIHHGFWRFMDREHRKFAPGEHQHAIRDYYRYLDREIGELIDLAGPDTAILVVSDHGAKRIDGGICVNEWLMREGYLRLRTIPPRALPLEEADVDWSRTAAWGAGGYYARIFLNVKGREPQGCVAPEDYERVRNELAEGLKGIPDEDGSPIPTRVFKPQEIYRECNGIPPDLIVYFGDLLWRSIGQVGGGELHTFENDTGPDDANHAQHGIFIMNERKGLAGRRLDDLHLRDVAPTILRLMGQPVPEDMTGRAIAGETAGEGQVYTAQEEAILKKRLRDLGYL